MHRCAVSIAVNVSQSCDALRACILGAFSHATCYPIGFASWTGQQKVCIAYLQNYTEDSMEHFRGEIYARLTLLPALRQSAAVNVSQSRYAFSLRSWDVFARGAFADSQSESDAPASQALGVLVRVGCTPCGASTPRLSTSSSLRRLTGLLREKLHLRAGFTLRCFQRLSFPDAATQLHGWRHDWYTVGPSTPVLSY